MKSAIRVGSVTIVIATLVGLLTFFINPPSGWKDSWFNFHGPLALTSAAATLLFGATVIFTMSFGSYKLQVRKAYTMILVSIVLTAVGSIQLPIVNGFNLWDVPWVTNGGLGLPFVFSGLAAYLGTRSFARTVGIQTVLTRVYVVLPGVLVLAYLSRYIPHITPQASVSEFAYNLANAVLIWCALLYLTAGLVIIQVKQRIGVHYIHAMAWLSLGLLLTGFIILLLVTDSLITTANQDAITNFSNFLIVIGGLLFMKAGYEFYKITDY